jgi:hypothetical protein
VRYMKKMSFGGRVLVALVVAGSAFGVAAAVQAAIPSSDGVIHGCYGKTSTPQRGELRVINAENGEQCRYYENPLNWNQIGPTGVTGPTGPTGPSDTYFGSGGNVASNDGGGVTVASVAVPAGTYLAVGTGWAASLTAGSKNIRCYIDQPNGNPLDTFLAVAGVDASQTSYEQESFGVHVLVVKATAGNITVGCLDSGAAGEIIYGAQITATKIGAAHGTTVGAPTKKLQLGPSVR